MIPVKLVAQPMISRYPRSQRTPDLGHPAFTTPAALA
jgi:hypothetical protein